MYDELPMDREDIELLLIDREQLEEEQGQTEENYLHLENAQLEARLYAKKIKEWIGHNGEPLQVIDKETEQKRRIEYRDIAILLRSMTHAPVKIGRASCRERV